MTRLGEPHAVYRFYGPGDVLLYIGITSSPAKRFAVHRCKQKSTWWSWVEHHEIVWHPNHQSAKSAETRELRAHRPICNPVIPEETGKHVTVVNGRPVRSLYDQCAALAEGRGETALALVTRAIEREIKRVRREAGREGNAPTSSSD